MPSIVPNNSNDKVAEATASMQISETPKRFTSKIKNQISSPNVSPAFGKHLFWPGDNKITKKKKLRNSKTGPMKYPHAISGQEMRKFLRQQREETLRIEKEELKLLKAVRKKKAIG